MNKELEQVMKAVKSILENSEGLEIEVLSWAFIALKERSETSILEAIEYGFNKWVK